MLQNNNNHLTTFKSTLWRLSTSGYLQKACVIYCLMLMIYNCHDYQVSCISCLQVELISWSPLYVTNHLRWIIYSLSCGPISWFSCVSHGNHINYVTSKLCKGSRFGPLLLVWSCLTGPDLLNGFLHCVFYSTCAPLHLMSKPSK